MCKAERELCEEAEKIGETRGRKEGILAYVARLLRMNVSKEDVLDALCEDFHLSREKAITYLP